MRMALCCLLLCLFLPAAAAAQATQPSVQVGHIDHPPIAESSGIIASRTQPGVFWTHNDSGNPAVLYAIDRSGKLLGEWAVGARNIDWEDIATDDTGHLYIADIGNNSRNRPDVQVLKVPEPQIGEPADQPLPVVRSWRLRYAEGKRFDAEALFVHGETGYILSKEFTGQASRLCAFNLAEEGVQTMRVEATLPIRSPVTGADLSADGRWLAVITVTGPRAFEVKGEPARAATLTPLSAVYLHPTMEAITIVEEGLLATTESRQVLLFTWEQLRAGGLLMAPARSHLVLPRRTLPLEIDGRLDDWPALAAIELQRSPPDAAPATLWATWDEAGLWLAVRVPDPEVSDLSTHWFTGDCVEVFVGSEADGRSADYGAGDTRLYCGFVEGQVVIRWPRGDPRPGARVASRIDPGQYDLELFLPAPGLRSGQQIRLEVSALSRVPRANWFLSTTNADGTWLSPLKWAIATLQ